MSTLTFDRFSGNVPVVDSLSGDVIGTSFTPFFKKESFRLEGLAVWTAPGTAYFILPPEIVSVNSICALAKARLPHTAGEFSPSQRNDLASLEDISTGSAGSFFPGIISSITVDAATGMPLSFSTSPAEQPAESMFRPAPAAAAPGFSAGPAGSAEVQHPVEKSVESPVETPVEKTFKTAENTEISTSDGKEPDAVARAVEILAKQQQSILDILSILTAKTPQAPAEEVSENQTAPASGNEAAQADEAIQCFEPAQDTAEEPENGPAFEAGPLCEEPAEFDELEEDGEDFVPTVDWMLSKTAAPKPEEPQEEVPAQPQEKPEEKPDEITARSLNYDTYYEDTTPEEFFKQLESIINTIDREHPAAAPQDKASEEVFRDVMSFINAADSIKPPLQDEPEQEQAPGETREDAAEDDAAEEPEAAKEACGPARSAEAEEPEAAKEPAEEPEEKEEENAPDGDADADEASPDFCEEPETKPEEELKAEPENEPDSEAEAPSEEPEEADDITAEAQFADLMENIPLSAAEEEEEEEKLPPRAAEIARQAENPESYVLGEAEPAEQPSRSLSGGSSEDFSLSPADEDQDDAPDFKRMRRRRNGAQILGMTLFGGVCVLLTML